MGQHTDIEHFLHHRKLVDSLVSFATLISGLTRTVLLFVNYSQFISYLLFVNYY